MSSMHESGFTLYIEDILMAINHVYEYTHGYSFDDFSKDHKTIYAVVRNFEIIGEAANKIPKEFTVLNPEIPWEKMIGMRNKMIHEYTGVDASILWQTIQEDLPDLKEKIEALVPT